MMKPAHSPSVHTCPECHAPMVERCNRSTGEQFLGCSQYPTCRYTKPLPADVILRRMGQTELFTTEEAQP